MPSVVDLKSDQWTFGAEHEWGDWNGFLTPLPNGFARAPDHTVVNTNGVAAQPDVYVYQEGGEINTPPSTTPVGQSEYLVRLLHLYPTAAVNHRSNLHVHVRVPGLKTSLPHLKRVQEYVHSELPGLLDTIEPIPPGTTPAERKRARRRKVSHHTFLTPGRVKKQLDARTVQEFFEAEVPRSKAGLVMWHAQPRCCVNLRQLLQTDTVEFRHFPGTLDPAALLTCVEWCREFLLGALAGRPIAGVWGAFFPRFAYLGKTRAGGLVPFPKFPPFNEEREVRYQGTASRNGLPTSEVKCNIALVLEGRFNAEDSPEAYRKAQEAAGVVSRER